MDEVEALARKFHEVYERLAPSFGYETRHESAKPWEEIPEAVRALTRAVVAEVCGPAMRGERTKGVWEALVVLETLRDQRKLRMAPMSDAIEAVRALLLKDQE
jgi:hypothetical protein